MSSIDRIVMSPGVLVRGHRSTVSLAIYDATDTAITPASWTVGLYTAAGTAVATSSGTGAATWSPTTATTVDLGDDYRIRWVITESDGSTTPHEESATVAYQRLYRVIGLDDLERADMRLALTADAPLIATDSAVSKAKQLAAIDAAIEDTERWLVSHGNRSHLILTPGDLRGLQVAWTMARLLRSGVSAIDGLSELADYWEGKVAAEKTAFAPRYMPTEITGASVRKKARPAYFMGGSWDDQTVAPQSYPWRY